MSYPKTDTRHCLRACFAPTPLAKIFSPRGDSGRSQQVPSIQQKENPKFSSAFFWAFYFLPKDPSALPESSAVGD
ncbi:hypothetical protein IQ270_04340 [Microcoleus sp. LEGE 07076]|nr:hypothetical protein [Microcoleus sp. LEGE 07076]MBE9183971.1 hypothetical protein [Microcoleus sp. LEGE 07076]